MLERGVTSDPTSVLDGDVLDGHADATAELEQRVGRLEDAVTQLQDTRQLEERVAARVTDRVRRDAPVAIAPPPEPPGLFARLPRALLPLTVTTITPPNGNGASAGNGPPAAPRGVWALLDLFVELRTIWRMYVDPRYRLTWMGRVVPPVLLAAILTSWFWLPFASQLAMLSSTLATVFVKLADLALAFILYKALSREARRYRDCFPDAPAAPPATP